MQLISDDYKRLNTLLHEENPNYGTSGASFTGMVLEIVNNINSQDILDYGCGKGRLASNLPFKIQQYDPAISKYSQLPKPADIVVCTDVLEHIEPNYLNDVLEHISELTKKVAFLAISTQKAEKTLSDGRNAHLIVKSGKWWIQKLFCYFDLISYHDFGGGIMVHVKRKENNDQE